MDGTQVNISITAILIDLEYLKKEICRLLHGVVEDSVPTIGVLANEKAFWPTMKMLLKIKSK